MMYFNREFVFQISSTVYHINTGKVKSRYHINTGKVKSRLFARCEAIVVVCLVVNVVRIHKKMVL